MSLSHPPDAMRSTLRAAALAALVLLAGCAGGVGDPVGSDAGTPSTDTLPTADGGSAADATGGTVRFYISDQPAAIEDFRHLNVTVTRVGIKRGGENGSWTEYDVGGRTVDLTRLRGDNATLVGEFPLANGTYTTVFVHVSAVEGVLDNGERITVKLPSEKLQIHERFAVGPNESVDFVFDIAVHRAGKSGKYILRPVISESGTDVPIHDVDDRGEDEEEEERALNVTLVGNATPGEDATLRVTANGTPVANASVSVNGEPAGTTDADGRLTVAVPADAEELELEVRHGEREGELEVEFEEREDEADESDDVEEDENDESEDESELTAEFVGDVTPGERATVTVTRDGGPVADATVTLDGEAVGTTNASGRLSFDVPADADSVTVTVTAGDDEAELEVEYEAESGG